LLLGGGRFTFHLCLLSGEIRHIVSFMANRPGNILFLRCAPCRPPILTCDNSRYVLMREGKHFRQQIVLVKVLEVVDLIEVLQVLVRHVLNLV